MLEAIALFAIRRRLLIVGLLAAVLALGGFAALSLPIDAMPDVSTIQVDVLTKCGGLSPAEVERTVTFPIERAMTGVPRSVQVRSVSRFGLSAVTVVFSDGTDIWLARQLVAERVHQAQAELPPSAGVA